jgi:hypothetical protein
MARASKTPEGKLVLHPMWQGGTVTNDSPIIRRLGIVSPAIEKVYAVAYHKKTRAEVWLKSPERLKRWKNTTINLSEYEIKIKDQCIDKER